MANAKKRQGTASEHQVFGQLIDVGFDVYQTMVDDQGIDAVLRVTTRSGTIRYFDMQIKSSRSWSGIRGTVGTMSRRNNTVLILFNSSISECLWFDSKGIAEYFSETPNQWGDVFLNKSLVDTFKEEGRNDLSKLLHLLEGAK